MTLAAQQSLSLQGFVALGASIVGEVGQAECTIDKHTHKASTRPPSFGLPPKL